MSSKKQVVEKPIKRSFQVLPSRCIKFTNAVRASGKKQWAALDEAMELWLEKQAA